MRPSRGMNPQRFCSSQATGSKTRQNSIAAARYGRKGTISQRNSEGCLALMPFWILVERQTGRATPPGKRLSGAGAPQQGCKTAS